MLCNYHDSPGGVGSNGQTSMSKLREDVLSLYLSLSLSPSAALIARPSSSCCPSRRISSNATCRASPSRGRREPVSVGPNARRRWVWAERWRWRFGFWAGFLVFWALLLKTLRVEEWRLSSFLHVPSNSQVFLGTDPYSGAMLR